MKAMKHIPKGADADVGSCAEKSAHMNHGRSHSMKRHHAMKQSMEHTMPHAARRGGVPPEVRKSYGKRQ